MFALTKYLAIVVEDQPLGFSVNKTNYSYKTCPISNWITLSYAYAFSVPESLPNNDQSFQGNEKVFIGNFLCSKVNKLSRVYLVLSKTQFNQLLRVYLSICVCILERVETLKGSPSTQSTFVTFLIRRVCQMICVCPGLFMCIAILPLHRTLNRHILSNGSSPNGAARFQSAFCRNRFATAKKQCSNVDGKLIQKI